jgi:hypothetical protein
MTLPTITMVLKVCASLYAGKARNTGGMKNIICFVDYGGLLR